MRYNYTNLPSYTEKSNTVKGFEGYQNSAIGHDPTTYAAFAGFFQSRGFQEVASEVISETILTQAKQDGYNPMQILDTLKGLDNVSISGIVAEILNYNRYKSSSLGSGTISPTNAEVERNIIP
jgi:hypothetical protein